MYTNHGKQFWLKWGKRRSHSCRHPESALLFLAAKVPEPTILYVVANRSAESGNGKIGFSSCLILDITDCDDLQTAETYMQSWQEPNFCPLTTSNSFGTKSLVDGTLSRSMRKGKIMGMMTQRRVRKTIGMRTWRRKDDDDEFNERFDHLKKLSWQFLWFIQCFNGKRNIY